MKNTIKILLILAIWLFAINTSGQSAIKKMVFGEKKPPFTVELLVNVTNESISGISGHNNRGEIYMSPNGQILNFGSYWNDRIITLQLDSPNDLSSYTMLNNPAPNDYNLGMHFDNGGLRMWIARLGSYVRYSDLTTPYIPSPRTDIGTVGVGTSAGYVTGIFFSTDGSMVYYVRRGGTGAYTISSCPTPFSLIGATEIQTSISDTSRGFRFFDGGNKALIYRSTGQLQLVSLGTPNDLRGTKTILHEETVFGLGEYDNMYITEDLKYIYVGRSLNMVQYKININ